MHRFKKNALKICNCPGKVADLYSNNKVATKAKQDIMQQRIDERLLEKFSSAQLDTAWMNREESIKEGILEEGGSLNDDMPPFHQRQMEFHNLAQDEIRFWIDYGPYTVHDFQD